MPEISRRISMTIDLKKNRLRIHRPTLRLLGFPPFIKLLFSRGQNAVAVIRCEKGEIPRINEVRVNFDPSDERRTFDIYSKDLTLTIRQAFSGIEVGDHTAFLRGVVSRKKQMVPALARLWG